MQPREKTMTSLRLSSHSQLLSIFPYFGVDLSLHSKHPSANPAFSALHSISIDRPCARTWMLGLAVLLPAALSPGTCNWLWLMPIQGADGRAYPPYHPISKVLAPLLQMHFLLFLFKRSNTPHPLNWTLSLPLVQDQVWAPWHLKIKLSYWFIDAWYLHFPFL